MIKFLDVKRAYYADPENVKVRGRGIGSRGDWCVFTSEPAWIENWIYELVPRTIRIGDIDVPEPVREALPLQTKCFYPMINHYDACDSFTWQGDKFDKMLLSRGLIHLTKEAAIAHAKALIIISGGKIYD